MDDFDRFAVVLCGAEESGNVGAACRAMKTMGFKRLKLAACRPVDEDRARTMAVHAFDVYEASERFDTLADALADVDFAVGFTRRLGQRRKDVSIPVDRFAEEAWRRAPGRIALVFGNERSGLSREELDLCDAAVHVPSSDDFPSLNLSHAVQIACWELRRVAPSRPAAGALSVRDDADPATRAELDAAVERVTGRMAAHGCFRLAGRRDAEILLRSAGARAGLSRSELRRLESLAFRAMALAKGGELDRADGGE